MASARLPLSQVFSQPYLPNLFGFQPEGKIKNVVVKFACVNAVGSSEIMYLDVFQV